MPETGGSSEGDPVGAGTATPPFWRRRRVVVRDASMRPTLEPGDRLLVDTGAYRVRAPVAGEVVVLTDPDDPRRWLVKRVRSVEGDRVFVVGDLGGPSRDSRTFGPVPRTSLVGRVVRRYAPSARSRSF